MKTESEVEEKLTSKELQQYQYGWTDGWQEGYECGLTEKQSSLGSDCWMMFLCGLVIGYFIFNGGLF